MWWKIPHLTPTRDQNSILLRLYIFQFHPQINKSTNLFGHWQPQHQSACLLKSFFQHQDEKEVESLSEIDLFGKILIILLNYGTVYAVEMCDVIARRTYVFFVAWEKNIFKVFDVKSEQMFRIVWWHRNSSV